MGWCKSITVIQVENIKCWQTKNKSKKNPFALVSQVNFATSLISEY